MGNTNMDSCCCFFSLKMEFPALPTSRLGGRTNALAVREPITAQRVISKKEFPRKAAPVHWLIPDLEQEMYQISLGLPVTREG